LKFVPLPVLNTRPEQGHEGFRLSLQKGQAVETTDRLAWLTVAVLLIGAGLRVGQYAMGEALWYDELALARNLVEKPIRELLTAPLDYAQVAPPGFMLIEKAAITELGNNEYALRLFPLLCALASLPLFAGVARRTLPAGAALLAVTLFSLSPTVIGFGSQMKQYSTDVAVALLMAALTLRWWERRHSAGAVSGAALLGALGLVAVWFSYAAVLVLAGLGTALLLQAGCDRERASFWSLAPIAILWCAAMLGAMAWGLQTLSPSTQAYMREYWAEGFMPLPPRSGDEALWLWRAFRSFFHRQLRYPVPAVGVILMALGTVTLLMRRQWSAFVLLAPIGVALLASAASQYPFGERVALYLVPSLLLLVAEGVDRLRQFIAGVWPPLGTTVFALVAAMSVYTLYDYFHSYSNKDVREVLAYVQARRLPQDAVYVYHNASHAVAYYGPRYRLLPGEVVFGGCPGANSRRLLNDIDQFRGRRRLWLIISHAVGPFREREAMIGYLTAIGVERDSILTGRSRLSSSAYLYDLSDVGRLRAASANTHILPAREHGIREFPCPPLHEPPNLEVHLTDNVD
jgi:hypothetical protein